MPLACSPADGVMVFGIMGVTVRVWTTKSRWNSAKIAIWLRWKALTLAGRPCVPCPPKALSCVLAGEVVRRCGKMWEDVGMG